MKTFDGKSLKDVIEYVKEERLTSYGQVVKIIKWDNKELARELVTNKDYRKALMPYVVKNREGGYMNKFGLSVGMLRNMNKQ